MRGVLVRRTSGSWRTLANDKNGLRAGRNFLEEVVQAHFQYALTNIGRGNGPLFGAELLPFRNNGLVRRNVKKFEENVAAEFAVLRRKDFSADIETVEKVEAADKFAGELHVGDLVFADGNVETFAGLAVHDDVGGLQRWVAEEAVSV